VDDTPFDLAVRLTEEYAALTPLNATLAGIAGHDHEWDDFSPDGAEAMIDLANRYRSHLHPHLDHADRRQRHAARVVYDWLGEKLDYYDQAEHLRHLSHAEGPFESVRSTFEVMEKETSQGWHNICRRLETADHALRGLRLSLEEGRRQGIVAARRQVQSVIDQARHLAGPDSAWEVLATQLPEELVEEYQARLSGAIARGKVAAGELAEYLQSTYLGAATEEDAVGRERYLPAAERFLGLRIDPAEVYGWGWSEVRRLMEEMERVAQRVDPGRTLNEVIDVLENDPAYSAPDPAAFIEFVEALENRALAQLDGVHFDVPEPVRPISVNLAPPGGALGAHYVPPSEDFSRPGGIWYAAGDRTTFPLWQEVATAYHEGFPGHHLQNGISLHQAENLCRTHRTLVWYSGYGEGWALYTERLMDELGFYDKPEYLLGMLASQLFRACRVVVDIGCHLGYRIPADAPLMGGDAWSYSHAVQYMHQIGRQPLAIAESEVLRYLGWPGQAISYKVGEREILNLREDFRRLQGRAFDLKAFHSQVLNWGEVRLDYLRESVIG
jgi:uncharacterized protein (DUF885 family)